MNEKFELLDEIYERAFLNEKKYGFCPQAVLAALQFYFSFISDDIIKASHTFAGGGALLGEGTCGGLAGGYLAIGSACGREKKDFGKLTKRELIRPVKLSKSLNNLFLKEFKSVICEEIQEEIMGRKFNLWDPEEYRLFEEAGGHEDKCTNVTGKAATWTAKILFENGF